VSWVPNDESGRAIATSELEAIFAEFLETEKTKGSLSLDLAAAAAASAEASASVYPEIHGLATDYLNNLRTQLLTIQDFTEHLAHQQKQLRDQVNQLPKALDVVALQCQLQELSRRIPLPESTTQFKERIQEVLQNELQLINQQLQTLPNSPQYELLFDLNGTPLEPEDQGAIVAGSRAVLEEALEKAQQRLILVWPWAGQQTLDDALIRKFEAFLSKGRQLDIGWCQLTDRHEERLLSKIRRGWLADAKLQTTQESLQKFLKLKKAHPTAFQFKILGTSENFLVADQEFAVLGITDTLKTHLPFSEVQLKLRTKDAEVIQRLTRCYDHPKLADDDLTSYWNRAVTRHELGDKAGAIADYEHILHISPDDAMTYAYRGLVHYDLGNLAAASSDFSQSTLLNPHQFAAYCNRGFIHAEQGDQGAAISDYSLAIEEFPDCAIAYFYRGMAWQKLENFQEAIADYGEALRYLPETAVVHYYRGLSYQKLKQYGGALAHLEKATQIFSAQGNAVNAQKAARALTKVQQILVAHPELAIETPFTFPEPAPVNANGNSNGNSYDYANGNGNGYNDANGNGHSIDNGTPNENGNGNGKFAHSPIDAAPATSSQSIAQPPFEDQPFSLDFLNAPPAKGMKSQESEGQSAPAANGHSLPKPLTQPAKSELSEFETLINFFLSAHATAEQDWQPSPHEIASGLKKLESEASSHS
jgi:tetratricopeptide (TPR) repeat protein